MNTRTIGKSCTYVYFVGIRIMNISFSYVHCIEFVVQYAYSVSYVANAVSNFLKISS